MLDRIDVRPRPEHDILHVHQRTGSVRLHIQSFFRGLVSAILRLTGLEPRLDTWRVTARAIAQSPLLSMDDLDLAAACDEAEYSRIMQQQVPKGDDAADTLPLFVLFPMTLVAIAAVPRRLPHQLSSVITLNGSVTSTFLTRVVTTISITWSAVILARAFQHRRANAGPAAIASLTSTVDACQTHIAQAIQFIQQTELVAHGYRPTGGVPASRLEWLHGELQCDPLRQSVLHSLRLLIDTTRLATINIMKHHVLVPYLDSPVHYIAFTDLHELGYVSCRTAFFPVLMLAFRCRAAPES